MARPHGSAVNTERDEKIVARWKEGLTRPALAREFGLSETRISQILFPEAKASHRVHFRCHLQRATLARLKTEAEGRNLLPSRLGAKIIEIVLNHNLLEGVLDDE